MSLYELSGFIEALESWGIADVLLPFILVFAIVYAVLDKVKIFGDEKRNINMVIALVVGLSVVIPHVLDSYPPGADVVDMINIILPQVSLVAIAFIMVLVLVGVFGGEWIGKSISGWLALLAAILQTSLQKAAKRLLCLIIFQEMAERKMLNG